MSTLNYQQISYILNNKENLPPGLKKLYQRWVYSNPQVMRNLGQVVKLNGMYWIYNPSLGRYAKVAYFVPKPGQLK